jgi:hypothetical protein
MSQLNLGNDPTLANGIDATGEMEDDDIGPQKSTEFIVKVTNKSATAVPNYRVFVNRLAGSVTLSPANVLIPTLGSGETEECRFQVRNSTNAVQTNYTFRIRSTYFGAITHQYNNFQRP